MNEEKKLNILVTGGRGFIGSHFVDYAVSLPEVGKITVIDCMLSGDNANTSDKVTYYDENIMRWWLIGDYFKDVDYLFHFAAIARTPWCIKDPRLCYGTNVMGTLNVLEAAREAGVKKVVLSSSNIVYAANTPYKHSKLGLEALASTYRELYHLPTVCLRYSNVYGTRQREDGESPNVFAAFRTSLRENGVIKITGDGEQTRDFTHVSDIVRANWLAAMSNVTGELDVCTGRNVTMNYVATLFNAKVEYIPERLGDIKHIVQKIGGEKTRELLQWEPKVVLEDGIKDVL